MTATTVARKTQFQGEDVLSEFYYVPVAASTKILNGWKVALNQSGYATTVSGTDPSLKIIGVAEHDADNTNGSAGDLYVKVRRGCSLMINSATTDAITNADIGAPCYSVDNQTVARTSNASQRPVAGTVHHVDDDGVWVEIGISTRGPWIDSLIVAGEDLSSDQYKMVKVSSAAVVKSGAGEKVFGVLQNAPANGAMAIVRNFGRTRVKADATGVTSGDAVSSAAGGVARASTDAATGLASVKTDDAGAATDPLKAGYVAGLAITTGAANAVFEMMLTHSGAVAVTAV